MPVAPTYAAVFQASTDVSAGGGIFALFTGGGESVFSLPRYSGPGTITGITIAASGSGMAAVYFNYLEDQALMIAPFSQVWTIVVFRPVGPSGVTETLDLSTTAEYPGLSVPPNVTPPLSDEFSVEASAVFSGSVELTNFSDFAGSGSNDFVFYVSVPGQTDIGASATVTETITFTTPEPSTWMMMALGFAGLGFASRRTSRMNSTHSP
jgi:hypothetical protein